MESVIEPNGWLGVRAAIFQLAGGVLAERRVALMQRYLQQRDQRNLREDATPAQAGP